MLVDFFSTEMTFDSKHWLFEKLINKNNTISQKEVKIFVTFHDF